jgi:hypothetical protein
VTRTASVPTECYLLQISSTLVFSHLPSNTSNVGTARRLRRTSRGRSLHTFGGRGQPESGRSNGSGMGHGELNLGNSGPSWTHQWLPRMTNGPQVVEPAGRPVDCLGLTKRWSLYVASMATPGITMEAPARPDAGISSKLTGSCAGCSCWRASARQPRLEQPALSLSHLTWS